MSDTKNLLIKGDADIGNWSLDGAQGVGGLPLMVRAARTLSLGRKLPHTLLDLFFPKCHALGGFLLVPQANQPNWFQRKKGDR